MPALPLNQSKKWVVNNADDYGGNIVSSFGINLRNNPAKHPQTATRGGVMASGFLSPNTTQVNVTGMVGMDGAIFSNADHSAQGNYFAIDTVGVYKTGSLSNHFALDTFTNTPVPNGDIVVFGRSGGFDNLIVATDTNLVKLNSASAWTANWWTSTLSQPALISSVGHPMSVMRQPFLLIIGDSNLVHTVDQNNNVQNSRVILPNNHLIEWIRTTQTQVFIGVRNTSNGVPGMYTYDPINETVIFYPISNPGTNSGIPLIHEETMYLFTMDGRLKVFNGGGFDTISETPYSKQQVTPRFHRNAALSVQNLFYFLLSTGLSRGIPDGLYVFDLIDQNFYHAAPIMVGASDAGQWRTTATQGLYSDATTILAGIQDYAGTTKGIYDSSNNLSNVLTYRAWFLTPRIQASSEVIKALWRHVWVKYKLYSTDTIKIKVRSSLLSADLVGGTSPHTGTWTSTTTFASDTQLTVGQEIIIYDGTGASLSAFVTVAGGGGFTITLDTAIGQSSGDFHFIATNFGKVATISNISTQSAQLSIPTATPNNSEWIQFKIELDGASAIIDDLILDFAPHITVT